LPSGVNAKGVKDGTGDLIDAGAGHGFNGSLTEQDLERFREGMEERPGVDVRCTAQYRPRQLQADRIELPVRQAPFSGADAECEQALRLGGKVLVDLLT
jgi:hypothetical protein